jgi:hypothetical protein
MNVLCATGGAFGSPAFRESLRRASCDCWAMLSCVSNWLAAPGDWSDTTEGMTMTQDLHPHCQPREAISILNWNGWRDTQEE